MKKFISLFLVVSILLLSGNMFAKERKGADLIIQKTDGTQVRGELIAVKENSLLLMDRDTSILMSIDIGDIRVIEAVKKSKLWKGAGLGFLAGAATGALYGRINQPLYISSKYYYVQEYYFGAIGALACGIIGGLIGASVGKEVTIQIEGKSDSEIQEILENLRKKARVKNAQ